MKDGKLLFSGLTGGLKVRLHRHIPEGASLKACAFTKSGRFWFVTIQMDVPVTVEHAFPDTKVGIDVGVEHLAFLSDGSFVENPKFEERHAKKVRIAHRALARCKRASNRRAKVREIANSRSTYLHQVSAGLARNFALIAVEKLNVKNMTASAKGTVEEPGKNVRQKAGLNRSVLDAAFSKLILFTDYKAERAGGHMEKVSAYRTSQECNACGRIVKKSLKQRWHSCACGAELPRDFNSVIVILERALSAPGRAMPPGDGNAVDCHTRRLGKMVSEAA